MPPVDISKNQHGKVQNRCVCVFMHVRVRVHVWKGYLPQQSFVKSSQRRDDLTGYESLCYAQACESSQVAETAGNLA